MCVSNAPSDKVSRRGPDAPFARKKGSGMFAKTLVPGSMPIPTLTTTTSEPDVLFPQLVQAGWGWYGGPPPSPQTTQLLITHRSLRVVVDGAVILDDLDPASPPGWWKAVDGLEGKCVVLVIKTGAIDLGASDAGARARALMDERGAGVWALTDVRHPAGLAM